MPHRLTFLQGDTLNTTLTNTGGTPAYIVETPFKILGNRVTTIKRVDPGGDALVASIEWMYPYDAETTIAFYNGKQVKIGRFLAQKQPFAIERYMKCVNEKEYEWINYDELKDCEGNTKAKYTRGGFEFKRMRWRNAVLDIYVEDICADKASYCRMVDKVVVALIILEAWRRRQARYAYATEEVD